MNLQDREVELNFREVTCKRSVQGSNFSRGIQDYDFSVSGKNAFIPSLSYFLIDASIVVRRGNAPRLTNDAVTEGYTTIPAIDPVPDRQPYYSDGVALADHFGSCLYNNAFFRAGNSDVSLITQYIPQAGVLKSRLDKSGSWSKNVGRIVFQDDADFTRRRNYISYDGTFHDDGLKSILYKNISLQAATGVPVAFSAQTTFAYTAATGLGTFVLGGAPAATLAATQLQPGDIVVTVANNRFRVVSIRSALLCSVEFLINTPVDAGASEVANILRPCDPACGANITQVMFQPPIGIFSEANPISGGDFKISLNPSPNYKVNGVQSLTLMRPKLEGGVADYDYDLVINDVKFYVCTIKSDVSPSGVIPLSLIEMAVLNKTLNPSGGTQNIDFTVPPSTLAITVFVQGGDCGNETVCPATKFYLQPGDPDGLRTLDPLTGTALVNVNNTANRLSQLQVTYGSVTKTQTLYTSGYNIGQTSAIPGGVPGGKNAEIQRFLQSIQYSGKITSEGGSENMPQFLERGSYWHFDFSKDKNDTSSYVNVQIGFETNIGPSQNLFIVAHYSRQAEIMYENGFITQVVSVNR
jgi:hypothetical protein